jgi:hypothetical protein
LPLVACLLALPQKDLLQGLTNLTSCNIIQYCSNLRFYHPSEAQPLGSRFNYWSQKYNS